jgi:predicted extracellular nuclease
VVTQRPVLSGSYERAPQTFIKSLLAKDPLASVVVAGDFNEFTMTRSAFAAFDGVVFEVDALAGIPATERYTYVFDNLQEQLDHMFVSPAVATRKVEVEHVHVNSWAPSIDSRTSDHDPSVARLRVC